MRRCAFVSALILLAAQVSHAQLPAGFSWIDIESDKKTMPVVRRALHDPSITAIREVGLQDDFALVMTASRDTDAPTPDYDRWTIYNIALATGKSKVLISGYGVNLLNWMGPTQQELAMTYYDCWGCEGVRLFSTLRFKKGIGWRARWINKTNDDQYPTPGVLLQDGSAGEPLDDNEVDQIFALVTTPDGNFAAGIWSHTHNLKTGTIEDDVERYSVNPATGEDRIETLHGAAALAWKLQLCTQQNSSIRPAVGQDSKACRSLLKTHLPQDAPKK